MLRNKVLILLVIISGLLNSCIDENDSLVNPPPKSESVKVRFINLAGDKEIRTLSMEELAQFTDIAYGASSSLIQPPADSTSMIVKKNGNIEYRLPYKQRYARNLIYTVVALPSHIGANNYRVVDTLISFTNSSTIPATSIEAYLKLFNAIPDSLSTYSLALGCPNGQSIFQGVQYRRYTPAIGVRSGEITVSLIKNNSGIPELKGLYKLNLQKRGQYTLFVRLNSANEEELVLLNEMTETTDAMSYPERVNERKTFIRTINLSSQAVDLAKAPGSEIVSGLVPFRISNYKDQETCVSTSKDTIVTYINGNEKNKTFGSFDVNEKYTIITADSGDYKAQKTIIIEPVRLREDKGSKSIIRVVNASSKQVNGITVSLGARETSNWTKEDSIQGFRSGDVMASKLHFGQVSDYYLVPQGVIPVAVFTSSEPAKYLLSSRLTIESNKNYLLIFAKDENGDEKVSLVEEETKDNFLSFSDYGVFVQLVNVVPGKNVMNINFPGLISNGKLYYGGSLATVVNEGSNTISLNGVQFNFNADKTKRNLIIASGTNDNIQVFDIQSPPMGADFNNHKRRFINASSEIQKVNVKLNDTTYIFENIDFKSVSAIETLNKAKKFSLIFENADGKKQLTRIDDILLTNGKNYSIIFAGNSSNGGYSLIIQQEY